MRKVIEFGKGCAMLFCLILLVIPMGLLVIIDDASGKNDNRP